MSKMCRPWQSGPDIAAPGTAPGTRIWFLFNTLRPRQDGCCLPDDIFKCIFFNENVLILVKISLKFVPKVPSNYIPALVQIMAWRRAGDKPLSGPVMVSLLTHICITRPQWVNSLWHSDAIWWHKSCSALAQVMDCWLTAPSHYLIQCWILISEGGSVAFMSK